ncbi:MAG: Gldg family protein [Planctomycetes bacterium]|nr:Gldg family protein [Planctomycetota bacterium]
MAMTRARRLLGRLHLWFASLVVLAIWILAMLLAVRPGMKALFDFSPQARFSVSPATAELLAGLGRGGARQLELHTFFEPLNETPRTADEAHVRQLRQRLQVLTRDLLQRYQYLGGEAVKVVHHDLLRDVAGTRAAATAFQVQTPNVVVVQLDRRSKILSVDYDLADIDIPDPQRQPTPGGQRAALPVLRDFKGEEAISSAIKSLLVEGTPTVYFVTGLAEPSLRDGTADAYSELVHALEQEGLRCQTLDLERVGSVPEDATVLALMEPRRELSQHASDAVLAYLRRGGRLLLNVSYWLVPEDWNPTFGRLGAALGLAIGEDVVYHLVEDPARPGTGMSGVPAVQNLRITELSPAHPVTRQLLRAGRVPELKAGREVQALARPPEGVSVDTTLLRTRPFAWLARRTAGPGGEPEANFFSPPDREAYASRSVGAVATLANPAGREGVAVIISAAGFNNAGMKVNGDLALNLFQWLAERKELVSVRGERYVARKLDATAQQIERTGWLLIGGVPGLLLLTGIVVLWRRSRA